MFRPRDQARAAAIRYTLLRMWITFSKMTKNRERAGAKWRFSSSPWLSRVDSDTFIGNKEASIGSLRAVSQRWRRQPWIRRRAVGIRGKCRLRAGVRILLVRIQQLPARQIQMLPRTGPQV